MNATTTGTGGPAGVPTATVDTLVTTWRGLTGVCSDLDETRWKSSSGLPGWTVQDVLSHIVGTERFLEGLEPAPCAGVRLRPRSQPAGRAQRERGRVAPAARRRRGARRVGGVAPPARTHVGGGRCRLLRPADDHADRAGHDGRLPRRAHPRLLDPRAGPAPRPRPSRQPRRPGRRAHGRPAGADASDRGGQAGRLPEGAAVTIAITGAVERTVHVEVHDGRAAILDAPTGPLLATVTMPTEAFVVLATGGPPPTSRRTG